jgi:hypothetical protein
LAGSDSDTYLLAFLLYINIGPDIIIMISLSSYLFQLLINNCSQFIYHDVCYRTAQLEQINYDNIAILCCRYCVQKHNRIGICYLFSSVFCAGVLCRGPVQCAGIMYGVQWSCTVCRDSQIFAGNSVWCAGRLAILQIAYCFQVRQF